MEIPLFRFHDISFTDIQTSFRFPCFLLDPSKISSNAQIPILSGFHLFKRRKRGHSLFVTNCSSVEQGLQPRPARPKPSTIVEDDGISSGPDEEELERRKLALGFCSEIEKLVVYKRYEDALELFEILECQGGYVVGASTYEALVNACIFLKSVSWVKRLYNYMIRSGFEADQYLRNRVLLMHIKCGMMVGARNLFDAMPERNLTSWNIIIGGLVDAGDYEEAFDLFLIMWEHFSDASSRTFATMIRASAGLGEVYVGSQLHSCALKMGVHGDMYVSCTLIDMYSKCGFIEDARLVFDGMQEKTVVGWNSIIAGYALHGHSEEGLDLYYQMRDSGVKMDYFTFSIIISICARLASVEHAKQAHAGLVRQGLVSDIVANTALVDFYSKWGKIEDAQNVFDKMPSKNIMSWNALISGYGNHGRGTDAVNMFERMVSEGMAPNHVTFLAVLSSCANSGLSKKGWEIFESMTRDHKIKPRAMHYACMIELLGREELLGEAFALIKNAPFDPTENMWAALLTACRIHKNYELGKFAAEKLYKMEPEKLSNYIVLFNVYNSSGRFKEAKDVIQSLKDKGLRMLPACSWIEVGKKPHFFHFGDKSHVQSKEIYQRLDTLMLEIRKSGYTPLDDKHHLLPDVDEQKEQVSSYHSEKLAIAFGLISTPSFTPLQVVQGHRICRDCHDVIKLIALVTRREIVVRDASRFHHFKYGNCSCGDYW